MIILNIVPLPTPRPRVGKHGAYYPENYRNYKEALELLARNAYKNKLTGAIKIKVGFFMPIPASWSKKKKTKHIGQWHSVKPDCDNLIKGVKDALEGFAYDNDSQVCYETSYKVYSDNPHIEVELWEL